MIAPPLAGNVLGSADNSFAVAEWRDPGGESSSLRYIAPWHVHHNDDEAWYVLEGALSIRAGDDVIELQAGSAYLVSRGTPHTYWNPGPEPVRYLLFMTPAILRLIQCIHAASDRSPAAMSALFAEHDSALVDPPPGL
jgi:mannose-6-phosphate isomerase-like protein (cupin superfamily)